MDYRREIDSFDEKYKPYNLWIVLQLTEEDWN